jgi:hypothetical protein
MKSVQSHVSTTRPHGRVAFRYLVIALACTSAACGPSREDGSDEGCGGSPGETTDPTCPDPKDPIDPEAVVDDLEDGDGYVSSRTGDWWTASDDTAGATIVPPANSVATPEPIEGTGRCGSKYAMRVTGQGFLDWGALLGISLKLDTGPNGEYATVAYDASAYQGVAFWARIGDTSTNQVRFAISDVNSEPDGGACVEDGAIGEECFDTFGTPLTALDTQFRHYRIPFTQLTQRGFGLRAPALVTSAVYTVQFNFEPGAVFDFWVDDVAFY